MTETLPLTGERTAPGIWHENYWFARHEAAYRWIAANWLSSETRRVLDAGCGEGYGADLLHRAGARQVFGLDYEGTTLRHVAKVYPQVNLVQGNLVQTAFKDAAFELLVSLQTVEHLWEQPRFISECARITAPGATIVLSTPNRLTFPSGNWYHTKELTGPEFAELVEADLEIVETLGLWHGEKLTTWEREHGSCVDAQLASDHAQWPTELVQLVRETRYDDFVIRPGELDDSLDLIVVARPRTT